MLLDHFAGASPWVASVSGARCGQKFNVRLLHEAANTVVRK